MVSFQHLIERLFNSMSITEGLSQTKIKTMLPKNGSVNENKKSNLQIAKTVLIDLAICRGEATNTKQKQLWLETR